MKTDTSAMILTKIRKEEGVSNCYRLIGAFDAFRETEVFSVLLTTQCGNVCTEDFVYDISCDPDEAARFFHMLCEHHATALHLREIAEDFLCEAAAI